jgi:hypothetical protein
MDNEAFQKLVRDRAHVRSTKEIAREAVEDEFRRRNKGRKRRRHDDDSSGSEGEDKRGKSNNKRPIKPLFNPFASSSKSSEKDEAEEDSSKYRDRAKERREGKLLTKEQEDTNNGEGSSDQDDNDNPDMEVAPLSTVKGLDRSLIQREKQEMNGDNKLQQHTAKDVRTFVATKAEAEKFLSNYIQQYSDHTELSSDLMQYLELALYSKEKVDAQTILCGPAGRTLQRTSWIFAADGYRNRSQTWQPPKEIMQGTPRQVFANRATPMSASQIHQIEEALRKSERGKDVIDRQRKHDENTSSDIVLDQDNVGRKSSKNTSTSEEQENNDTIRGNKNETDSYEDIFGDTEEYAPPTRANVAKQKTSSSRQETDTQLPKSSYSKPTAHSVFENLLPEDRSKEAQDNDNQDSSEVDRFVSNLYSKLKKGREERNSKANNAGVGMSGSGDQLYGECLDMDFNGRNDSDDDDGKDKKKKKRKSEELTMAAREYGSGSKSSFK